MTQIEAELIFVARLLVMRIGRILNRSNCDFSTFFDDDVIDRQWSFDDDVIDRQWSVTITSVTFSSAHTQTRRIKGTRYLLRVY